jgi:hypothetical protein
MKVTITQQFDSMARKAVSRELYLDRPATKADCKEWLRRSVDMLFVTMLEEYDAEEITGKLRD